MRGKATYEWQIILIIVIRNIISSLWDTKSLWAWDGRKRESEKRVVNGREKDYAKMKERTRKGKD